MFGGEASDKSEGAFGRWESFGHDTFVAWTSESADIGWAYQPLDLASKDVLKKAIRVDGTAIIVSHDRDFLDELVEKVYEFGGGKVREHIGGIRDYLSMKKLDNLQQLELSKSPTIQSASSSLKEEKSGKGEAATGNVTETKLSYQEQKELPSYTQTGEQVRRRARLRTWQRCGNGARVGHTRRASNVTMLQNYLETKAKMDRIMSNCRSDSR